MQSAISAKKVCPSPSFNDVDGDKIVKANMDGDDTPYQSDRNDQGEEEEEIKEDEDSTFGKPASKKIKPPFSPIKMIRKKRRRKLKKIRILLLKNLHQRNQNLSLLSFSIGLMLMRLVMNIMKMFGRRPNLLHYTQMTMVQSLSKVI